MRIKNIRPVYLAAIGSFLALLASCGGSDPPEQSSTGPMAKRTGGLGPTTALLTEPPADAYINGMWSEVSPWPLIAVHAVLMPDGRVASWGTNSVGQQTAYFIFDIWDPAAGPAAGHMTLPNSTLTDIFCGSQLILPNGGAVLVAGGDNWTGTGTTNTGNNNSNLLDYTSNTLTRGNNMNRARWYSSSTALINGEVYIQGGTGGTDRPEIRAADGTFRLLSGANTSGFDFMYPRNFVAPDGRVFGYDSAGRMYYIDPTGAGTATQVGQFASAYRGSDASAAMFRPGRILQFGGSSNGAIVIDINNATPAAPNTPPIVTPTQSMSSQRRLVTATILADGKVLATGGSRVWNELTDVNNIAEIWNPDTGQWTQGASGNRARLYHSTALLLPDASVLVAGGGAPGPQNNLNVEIYYPPYLFRAEGGLAPRPTIAAAPDTLEIGRTFSVDYADAASISRVTLVKTSSVTHSWNMEQRFVDLAFNTDGNRLWVQAPTRAGDTTPGYYLLFVIDGAGVPSVAKMVRIGIASNPNPATTPTLVSIGNQTGLTANAVDIQVNASDPNGDTLRYSASGLPPGLSIDSLTGRITGTPTTTGNYSVVIAVSDGFNSATVSLLWSITAEAPLQIEPLPAPRPVLVDTQVAFEARANGINTRYKWSFGDATPDSDWSSSGTASHRFTRAGAFYVTVTATDDRGQEQRRTFLQIVHLALTPNRPNASTSVAFELPASGAARVWVVNQDNDSVTAFDAASGNKLAEVAVGTAPRTIALAPDGMLWVTNQQSASISVIDPATRSVSRTIALPRASQPYGVVMAPTGGYAYVSLGATGQLRKIDVATSSTIGTLAVGNHPRHLSISGDGNTVYVSRFITPPLPGESTAVVSTTVGGLPVGGEVIAINAAGTMSVLKTIVLRHSDRPDFENQGRGVPNYLAAATISPDGTQAWVPSKQDNVLRGALRDGTGLNFQNTVRAISSRILLGTGEEDYAARVDHDNSSVASGAAFDPYGVFLFVALETSREIAVLDAHAGAELLRISVGRAPQGLALSADGMTLYVNNFMDRTLGAYDLRPLLTQGDVSLPVLMTLPAVGVDKLSAPVLLGKQLFYDARDTRLARDRYLSCATCHNDGGHDGRTWDLTGFGEGLRNTISLRGRAAGQGYLHWSNNFDEVQDFEGQIRALAGGTGLMSDADFGSGTRSQPLGDPKAGLSVDLDALAAYVASLNTFDDSPFRSSGGALSTGASQGKTVFRNLNCGSCHAGTEFTGSGVNTPVDIGTLKPTSGQRLGAVLTGIDIPTLRDVWATAPYLHDGSAATLEAAIRAHDGPTFTAASIGNSDLSKLVAYVKAIGREEASAPINAGTGRGLTGSYFNNKTLSGIPVLVRTEQLNFNWGSSSPGKGVVSDGFSVRWTGSIEAPATGTYRFQTISDDGIRVRIGGVLVIDNWTVHLSTTDTTSDINLQAGQKVEIVVEYFDNTGTAIARLLWMTPGTTGFAAVPRDRQYAP